MANFYDAFSKTLKHEGNYSNHPNDRGGETWKGVARRLWPEWKGWSFVDEMKKQPDFPNNLTESLELDRYVKDFYKENFWDRFKGDLFEGQDIAEEVFDTGVNMGMKRAIKFLQEACNLLNRCERDYADMPIDGIVGATTLDVVNSHPRPKNLLKLLNVLQAMQYVKLARESESQEVFLNGWLNRVQLNN